MKTSNHLIIAITTLCLTSLSSAAANARKPIEGAFVVSVTQGVAEVSKDIVNILPMPERKSLLSDPEALSSIKEAWKECYAAVLKNDLVTVAKYSEGEIPSTLTMGEAKDGTVRLLSVSGKSGSFWTIVQIETEQPGQGVGIIYDCHMWQQDDEGGAWTFQSVMYGQ